VVILGTLFFLFSDWGWEWEVGTLSNTQKHKFLRILTLKLLKDRRRPIIPIGWLLFHIDDELQNKNIYLA
jgi:hypothetical protein